MEDSVDETYCVGVGGEQIYGEDAVYELEGSTFLLFIFLFTGLDHE